MHFDNKDAFYSAIIIAMTGWFFFSSSSDVQSSVEKPQKRYDQEAQLLAVPSKELHTQEVQPTIEKSPLVVKAPQKLELKPRESTHFSCKDILRLHKKFTTFAIHMARNVDAEGIHYIKCPATTVQEKQYVETLDKIKPIIHEDWKSLLNETMSCLKGSGHVGHIHSANLIIISQDIAELIASECRYQGNIRTIWNVR
ncbi:MAG: hypothetical protein EAZ74_05895 [Alphaproteobacteria bacterium]|nr:MAG: hypothetical protein EAY76_02995 [Alphaproteobacteria bacterium]TAF13384.1 MAG: hypothetical protein EAZ74_05895 [Alphaproteobacteria bacterium]TAF39355.1 MAG: hypothetical protein EAZ66_04890 [Alphaproteobacteria bacterium]TAF75121.1 MAG: hypothetical protein EAZ52_07480 [Alphaproteobacteria bacterium]